jgi:hypothetical protein
VVNIKKLPTERQYTSWKYITPDIIITMKKSRLYCS